MCALLELDELPSFKEALTSPRLVESVSYYEGKNEFHG